MPFMSRYEILQLLHAHMYLLMCLNILNIPSFPSSYLVLNHFLPFIWDLQLLQENPKAFLGWMGDEICPACPFLDDIL